MCENGNWASIKDYIAMTTESIANYSNDPATKKAVELIANLFNDLLRLSNIPESIRQEASSEWLTIGVRAQAYSQITTPEERAKAVAEIASCLRRFRDRYAEFLCPEDMQKLKVYLQAMHDVIDKNERTKATIAALDDLFASWFERFDEQEMYESSVFLADIFGS